jgi:hypothetical protein
MTNITWLRLDLLFLLKKDAQNQNISEKQKNSNRGIILLLFYFSFH